MPDFNDFLRRHWGDIASVLGLFVSIIGFWYTLIQVRKSRTAAEQAQDAVRKMRQRMDRIDSAAQCAEAISIMDEIKRLQRVRAWGPAADRYSVLRKLLMSIREYNPWLNDAQQAVLVGAIGQFRTMEDALEKASTKEPDPTRLNRLTTAEIDKVTEVMIHIRKEGQEHNG